MPQPALREFRTIVQPELQPSQEVVQLAAEGPAMTDALEGFAASVARSGQLAPEGDLRLKALGSKKTLMLSAMVSGNCVQACQAGMMP